MSDDPKGFNPVYDDKKANDIIYFHKAKMKQDGSSYRKVELFLHEEVSYLSPKNKESGSTPVDFDVKEKLTLCESRGGQQKIQCWLVQTVTGNKYVEAIHISRRTDKGVYGSQEVVISLDGITALRDYLNSLFVVDKKDATTIPLRKERKSDSQKILSEQEFVELIKANVKSIDDFYTLLSMEKVELSVIRLERIIEGEYENEVDIQKFLKENLWMFGNDYAFIVENGKINAQNILDIVPQNLESFIDIVEVKLPSEKLFNLDASHNNYYPTANLTKAIAQTQNYIFELEQKTNDEHYESKNNCKVVRPKGIILFGSKDIQSEDESRYLRILNSSYHNLQIITYQQLLEKARNTLMILNKKERS